PARTARHRAGSTRTALWTVSGGLPIGPTGAGGAAEWCRSAALTLPGWPRRWFPGTRFPPPGWSIWPHWTARIRFPAGHRAGRGPPGPPAERPTWLQQRRVERSAAWTLLS